MAQYPMNIYTKHVQIFFTYIIPFSLINYYPLKYILGTSNNTLYIYASLVILIYIIPAVLIFNRVLKNMHQQVRKNIICCFNLKLKYL